MSLNINPFISYAQKVDAGQGDGAKKMPKFGLKDLVWGLKTAKKAGKLEKLNDKLDYLNGQLEGASGKEAKKLKKKIANTEHKIEKKEDKIQKKIDKIDKKLEKASGNKAEKLKMKKGILQEMVGEKSEKANSSKETSASQSAGGTRSSDSAQNSSSAQGASSTDSASAGKGVEKMGKFDDDKEGGKYSNNEVYNDWTKLSDEEFNKKYSGDGVLTTSETYTPDKVRSLLNQMGNSEAGKALLKEDYGISDPAKLSQLSDKDLMQKFYKNHKTAADKQAAEGGKGGGAAATAFDTSGLNGNPPTLRQLTIYQGKENHVMMADANQMTDDKNQAQGMSPDMLYDA